MEVRRARSSFKVMDLAIYSLFYQKGQATTRAGLCGTATRIPFRCSSWQLRPRTRQLGKGLPKTLVERS